MEHASPRLIVQAPQADLAGQEPVSKEVAERNILGVV
jgi:hypothetical protein